ncbi:MAG: hypothetical protein HY402_03915 [Elusimicrobia bacterium]|nr:hypothetical protein [Elusimicrobiota bacterium]
MRLFRRLGGRFQILREFFSFLWENKLWWMIPMFLVLLFFGALVILASQSPVAPFIYTLF